MSVVRATDISSSEVRDPRNILRSGQSVNTRHWLYELGWLRFFDNQSLGLKAGQVQCVGSKHPRMVDGEVIIERCGRALYIPASWSVVVTRHWVPMFMLCYQHTDQRADFADMYDRLSAEA